jgi:hypothetical protein
MTYGLKDIFISKGPLLQIHAHRENFIHPLMIQIVAFTLGQHEIHAH